MFLHVYIFLGAINNASSSTTTSTATAATTNVNVNVTTQPSAIVIPFPIPITLNPDGTVTIGGTTTTIASLLTALATIFG